MQDKPDQLDDIREVLLRLKQAAAGVGGSPLLNDINLDVVQRIEQAKTTDEHAKSAHRRLKNMVRSIKDRFDDNGKLSDLLNILTESDVYFDCLDKGIPIRRVREEAKRRTPDFVIDANGDQFLEITNCGWMNAIPNLNTATEHLFEGYLESEKRRNSGNASTWIETVFQPHHRGGIAPYDPRSRKMVIENVIEKIANIVSYKAVQLCPSKAILLCDISRLPLLGSEEDLLVQTYDAGTGLGPASGVLWNIAFGCMGDPVFTEAEFEQPSVVTLRDRNHEGYLKQDGILRQFNWLAGLVFRHKGDSSHWRHGFCAKGSPARTALGIICDQIIEHENPIIMTTESDNASYWCRACRKRQRNSTTMRLDPVCHLRQVAPTLRATDRGSERSVQGEH